jgi:hypothetical protein
MEVTASRLRITGPFKPGADVEAAVFTTHGRIIGRLRTNGACGVAPQELQQVK